jgi:hypothetical protein
LQEEHSVAESRVESTKDDLPTFRGIGEVLATYLGIPAILLYPIGLCVLAWQLRNEFDLKFLTSWYAASLVPTTVVAGLGVEVLLLPFFVSVLLATLISLAFANEFASEFARGEQELAEEHKKREWAAEILRGVTAHNRVTALSYRREKLQIGLIKAVLVAFGVLQSAFSKLKELNKYIRILLALVLLLFIGLLVVLAAKFLAFYEVSCFWFPLFS